MADIKYVLSYRIENHIENIVRELGFPRFTDISYSEDWLDYKEDYVEVTVATYRSSTDSRDDIWSTIKIPMKYIFNENFKKDIEKDKKEEEEIKLLKELQRKYPHIK